MTAGTATGAAPPSGCPVAHEYDAFEQARPFEAWAHLRADHPVFLDRRTGYWVVSGYDDVRAVFGDWETFSSSIAHEPVRERGPEASRIMAEGGFTAYSGLSARVPPDHTRIRTVVAKGFAPRRLAALEPVVREATVRAVDRMLTSPDRSADLLPALCDEIPVVTLLALLGIPMSEDLATYKRWSAARAAMTWSDLDDDEQVPHAHALVEYWRTCLHLVADAHEHERETLVGDLVRAQREGDPLSDHEIASVCYSMLFAGHETTTALMSNLFSLVLADRQGWHRLVADPGLAANTVEEVLRIGPSLTAWRRIATRDAEIGGVPVPAGARILLLLGSANRDGTVFPEPDTFDPGRENARRHVAFGYGIHYCLGHKLARTEARIVLEEVAARAPGLRLAAGRAGAFGRSLTVHAPDAVPVTWVSTVLVTGAAGGLGRAFALGLAAAGHRVAVGDLDLEGARGTADLVRAAGAEAWAGRLDVTSADSAAEVAGQVADFGDGRIDALVNNAGVYAGLARAPFEDLDPDEFDLALRVNVKGTWLVSRACSPFLGAGSSIVNIASATVFSGSPLWLHYVASKGAVIAMTRVMAKELGGREITVNTVAPGFTLTEASLSVMEDAATYGVDRGSIRRAGVPEDVVGAVVFLTGPGSRFVTGQTLVVDGGRQFL